MTLAKRIPIALFLLFMSSPAFAQTARSEKQLILALQNRVLTLRNFTQSNRLRFDINGQLENPGQPGTWTMYASLPVKKVEIVEKRVRISGPRILYHFDRTAKALVPSLSNKNVEVDLEITDVSTTDEILNLLSKMTVKLPELSPYVPTYWRRYLEGQTSPKPAPAGFEDFRTDSGKWLEVANGGTPPEPKNSNGLAFPKLLTRIRPQYSPDARDFLVEGVVILEAQVSESGAVDKADILIPVGADLDENAVESVLRWKYEPLIVNGKPTPFLTTITVNYAFSR